MSNTGHVSPINTAYGIFEKSINFEQREKNQSRGISLKMFEIIDWKFFASKPFVKSRFFWATLILADSVFLSTVKYREYIENYFR